MQLHLIPIFALVSLTIAKPQGQPQTAQPAVQPQPIQAAAQPQAPQGDITTPIPIVNQTQEVGENGTFNYSFQTGNGIQTQEMGYIKKNDNARADIADGNSTDIQVVQGFVSYTAPDGQVINLSYIADENGFQPQGEHLPTPPPIPEDIAKAISTLQDELQGQQVLSTSPTATL